MTKISNQSRCWTEVKLGDICEFAYGKSLPAKKRSGAGYPVYGSNGPVGYHDEPLTNSETIIIGRKGSFGEVHYCDGPCSPIDTTYYITEIQTNAYIPWLFRRLRSLGLTQLNRAAAIPGLNRADAYRLTLLLPPLGEQKRIAVILDAADALRAKRRESLALLDTLLQATFLDMFGEPVTNPMGWKECTVGDVAHSAKDGPHVSPKYSKSGISFLSTRHIKPGEVIWKDLKYIDQDEADRQWKKCKPEFGDILYTKGGTTGIAARVTSSEPFAVWVHVALLKPIVEKVDPSWLETMLNSAYCYAQSQRLTHGIANRDLGLKRMVKIKMYLPPLKDQRHFAEISSSLQAQKVLQRSHLNELNELFTSLQHRAFNGELWL